MLEFRVLGPLRVCRHGDEVHVGGPRQRRLLTALLLDRNQVVSADRLIEAVFAGDPSPNAAETLRTYVMRLRRVIRIDGADPALETRPPGYVLHAPDDAVDAGRFERLVADGRACRERGDPAAAVAAFRAALALWAGDPYAEFDDEGWVLPEARRLMELRAATEEQLVDAELACGLGVELVSRLEMLVAGDPLRESYRAQLMVALYRGGRHADALTVLREYREMLAHEVGLDPSPALEELAQRILGHDDSLQGGGPSATIVRGYRLGDRLGSGRDGTVHAAELPGVDRDLVIRVVPATIADRPDVVRSFDATLRQVAALHHDAIVPIDDHWREPGGAYIVMRRMRGGTLRDRLDRGGMSHEAITEMIGRLGSALQAASESGLVHGRVIPQSVLFDEAGAAYLSDFPLGEVDRDAGDDVAAFAALVLDALAGGGGPDAGGPLAAVLVRALSAETGPSIGELLADLERAAGTATRAPASAANPYKGLRAFGEADAADFFGRESLVDELVDRLGGAGPAGRLVLVVGASGSGKSSVVRAGLLPRVRAGAVAGSERWLVTTMVPGADPFEELADSLGRVATTSAVDAGVDVAPGPGVELSRDRAGIDAALRRLVPADSELLLVIDQLEELFTLAPTGVQRAFLAGLVHALSAPDSRLRVVATLRADFYDRPLRFQGLGPLVRDATVVVPAMQAAELEAAVTGPAARVGLEVEPPLVAELVASVVDQPAAMPALQFTLYELVEQEGGRLDLAGYRQLGGVGGAIAARAETLYQSVDATQDVVRAIFEQLLVIGPEGEPTRRRTPRSELAGVVGEAPLDEVIDPWARARLLSYDRHPHTREPTVEVAHEALLREWPRLRGWVEADRTAIVTAAQLRDAAEGWDALGRDPGALYRGSKLETTLEQLSGRAGSLPPVAVEFLEASRTARDERRAREAEQLARQARTNRRLRRQLTALAVAMLVAVLGGFLALDQRGRARAEQRIAIARELAAASLAVVEDDAELGILLALRAVEHTRAVDGTVLPEAEAALHRAVTASRIVMSVAGLGGSVAWHPDGTLFVTEGPEESGVVDLRDPETGASVRSFTAHDADVNDVAFSGDGALLATTADDGRLRVWDLDGGGLEAEVVGRGQVWGASFSADGSRVAAAWPDEGVVRVLDLGDTAPPLEILARTAPLGDSTSFAPEGDRLAVADADGVLVVDAVTGERQLEFEPGSNPLADDVLAVRWSPDGRWIASGSRGLTAQVTDARTGARHLTLTGHTDVFQLDWTPDGTHLATGARDGTTRVWEISDRGALERSLLATRGGAVGGVAFSPDGQRLLTGDVRVTVARIWDVGIGGGAEWMNLPTSPDVQGMAEFTPDGATLVLTGEETPATVWDLATGTAVRDLGDGLSVAWEVDVSPDGELVATIGWDEPPRVHVWDLRTGDLTFTLQVPGFLAERTAWSPDAELLAVAGWRTDGPGEVIVVDRAGSRVAELEEDAAHAPRHVAFSPDGERLVTQRRRLDRNDLAINGVRVWDWAAGEVVAEVQVFADVMALDPTGSRVAVGEVAAAGSMWDAATGERIASLRGHNGDITALAFSPAGRTVATSGVDGTVRLWAADTGTEQVVLDGRDGPVWSVAFSPDGARLASTSVGVARVWALDLDDLVAIAEGRTTRSLTDDECRQYLHVERCTP